MLTLKRAKHLKLMTLEEIKIAANNFEVCIGEGGYGKVYQGELVISGKPTPVAIKQLSGKYGQGLREFLTEIELLSGQKHPNLINLVGYCKEGAENTLVYEYAGRGSLDRYLSRSNPNHTLTWLERLKICVGAARGLCYLHNHVGKHQAIIHRDIKSANILIDKNWVAKISDLGLSKLSLAGLDRSEVVSQPCGTFGYCEPEYGKTGIVTKESDVYSFGIVLFEVLCGRLCTKDYYLHNSLDEIVDPSLKKEMNLNSRNRFAAIAKRCLHDDRGERPPMHLVMKELEESFKLQIRLEKVKRILQQFHQNEDGGLNKKELEDLLVATNSDLIKCSNELFNLYAKFIDGEKVLTCDGLLQIYDRRKGDLDLDYEVLRLKVKPHNGKEPTFSKWERYEKVWKIFQQYDLNDDGGLSVDELEALKVATYPDERDRPTLDFFKHYEPYVDGEKGLTFSGLSLIYDQGELDLDLGFKAVRFEFHPKINDQVTLERRRRNVVGVHWWLISFLATWVLLYNLLDLYWLDLEDYLFDLILSHINVQLESISITPSELIRSYFK